MLCYKKCPTDLFVFDFFVRTCKLQCGREAARVSDLTEIVLLTLRRTDGWPYPGLIWLSHPEHWQDNFYIFSFCVLWSYAIVLGRFHSLVTKVHCALTLVVSVQCTALHCTIRALRTPRLRLRTVQTSVQWLVQLNVDADIDFKKSLLLWGGF